MNRSPWCQVASALVMSVTCVQCSYDVVFSPSGAAGLAGSGSWGGAQAGGSESSDTMPTAAGRGGAGPNGGGAGSTTPAQAGAGAPPRVTLASGLSWQWQLTGPLDPSVAVDTFVVDLTETTADDLTTLHSGSKLIVCNFSAGTSETWRSDVVALPPEAVGNVLSGHSDEFWLDTRSTSVRSLMTKRLDLAQARGCSAVLPDSIDGYGANTGFSITKVDSLDYLSFLSQAAHARSLAIGLANAPELVTTAEPWFDFEVEVDCLEYDECDRYRPFLTANKAVFHAELVEDTSSGAQRLDAICGDSRRAGFATIVKTSPLGAWRLGCE